MSYQEISEEEKQYVKMTEALKRWYEEGRYEEGRHEEGWYDSDDDEELYRALSKFETSVDVDQGNEWGCFCCRCHQYVDKVSEKMGVRERQYKMKISQVGGSTWNKDLNSELVGAVYESMKDLIVGNGIPYGDRVYFG